MLAFLSLPTTGPIVREVHVNQRDINKGVLNRMSKCAVARAIRRQSWLPLAYLNVQDNHVTVEPIFGARKTYKLEPKGTDFIHKFDTGVRVYPTTLRMTLIDA